MYSGYSISIPYKDYLRLDEDSMIVANLRRMCREAIKDGAVINVTEVLDVLEQLSIIPVENYTIIEGKLDCVLKETDG